MFKKSVETRDSAGSANLFMVTKENSSNDVNAVGDTQDKILRRTRKRQLLSNQSQTDKP